MVIIILVVVVARRTTANGRLNRPQWPLTASSLVVVGQSGGGGVKVGRTEGVQESFISGLDIYSNKPPRMDLKSGLRHTKWSPIWC